MIRLWQALLTVTVANGRVLSGVGKVVVARDVWASACGRPSLFEVW